MSNCVDPLHAKLFLGHALRFMILLVNELVIAYSMTKPVTRTLYGVLVEAKSFTPTSELGNFSLPWNFS